MAVDFCESYNVINYTVHEEFITNYIFFITILLLMYVLFCYFLFIQFSFNSTWFTYSINKMFVRITEFTLPVSFLTNSKSFDKFSLILVEVVLFVMKPSRNRLRKRLCMLRIFFSRKPRLDFKKSKM